MSLDFYLESPPYECPHCGGSLPHIPVKDVFWKNITHNLNKMADAAGIYGVLWRPNENGQVKAKDIIPVLEAGLVDLVSRPDYFSQFNSPNGWGTYEHFVPFVQEVLSACKENPNALVKVSV